MEKSVVDLNHVVKEFLERVWDKKSPLLIAYSGGPDSRALFLATLAWGKGEIHLAHVDHGWREESAQEAAILEQEAQELGVPFHLLRLTKPCGEEEARKKRLSFFASLKKTVPYQAVLMGHQANDLAETALKRLFEGAHLTKLFGMQEESVIDGVTLWRPLLAVPKVAIESYLKTRSIVPLIDPTNRDPKYLRARMRLSLLPHLEETFGKGIVQNLHLLSERSLELDGYLSRQVKRLDDRVVSGPFGTWIEAKECERVELRYLLQLCAEKERLSLSRTVLETLLDSLEFKEANKVSIQNRVLIADRGSLFLLKERLPQWNGALSLASIKKSHSGDWSVVVDPEEVGEGGWQELWRTGVAYACVEEVDQATLSFAPRSVCWKEKSPPFLRKICPCIINAGGSITSFLKPLQIGKGRIVKIFADNK